MLLASYSSAGEKRTWTSDDRKNRIVGEMIGYEDGIVVILKDDNSPPVRVPIAKLSKKDADFAKEFHRKSLENAPREDGWVAHDGDNRWILDSKLNIGLPFGAYKWKIVTKDPPTFAAVNEEETESYLTVIWHPPAESRQKKTDLIKSFNTDNIKRLKALGVNNPKAERVDPASSKSQQFSTLSGTTSSGTEIACRSLVRFDASGTAMFYATGSLAEVTAAIEVADKSTHVTGDTKAATEPTSGLTYLSADSKRTFNLFVEKTKAQLAKSKAKEVLESIVAPDDLKQLNSTNRMDEAVANFDNEKRGKLLSIISTLDWSTAEYDAALKQLTFKPVGKPIHFIETSIGWRMKN